MFEVLLHMHCISCIGSEQFFLTVKLLRGGILS